MTTALQNYAVKPPNPWCQQCGEYFSDDETPLRVEGKDYHRGCIEQKETGRE